MSLLLYIADLDEKLSQTLQRLHKSTPNIPCLPSNSTTTNFSAFDNCRPCKTNYTSRCRTLPSLCNGLTLPASRFLNKSTETLCSELRLPRVPSLNMEFGGFTPHQTSASIPRSPLLRDEEGNVSIGEMDFFQQYNRNARGSVSTFLPEDDDNNSHQMRPSATSSFHEQSASEDIRDRVWGGEQRSLIQESLHEYHPEHVQVRTPPHPSMSQGYMSYDSSVNQSVLDTSGTARKPSPYALAHDVNVLAGNLSQTQKISENPPKTKDKEAQKKI